MKYGLYVEDEDGSLRLERELIFDEDGHVDLDVPAGKRWALGMLTEGATLNFAGPYDGPAPVSLRQLGTDQPLGSSY